MYICIECGKEFRVDTLEPLPENERLCLYCRENTYLYTFTDKLTGKEIEVRASSAELATLRAWKRNKNLSYKIQ